MDYVNVHVLTFVRGKNSKISEYRVMHVQETEYPTRFVAIF